MEALRLMLVESLPGLAAPLAVLAATLVAGLGAGWLAAGMLRRRARRSGSQAHETLLRASRLPFVLLVCLLGVYLAVQSLPLPPRALALAERAILILAVVVLTLAASRLASGLVRFYAARGQGALPVTSLTQNLAGGVVVGLGALVVLNLFGVSITPLLTALGVGGLAVALALQDTLSNLFAGFYVSLAGQVRLGDYIKLDSGEEGYVADIGWRSTSLRALANNMFIIPNSKLAQAILVNYCLPEKRMSLLIPVSVSYESDPDEVERVLLEVAQEGAQDIPGLLAEPPPAARFIPGFGDFALNFTLVCHVREFVDQYPVQHELRKRILKRFRAAGIEIPFPVRTVHLRSQAGGS